MVGKYCNSSLSRSALCSLVEVCVYVCGGVWGVSWSLRDWPVEGGQASQPSRLLWLISMSQEFLFCRYSCVQPSSTQTLLNQQGNPPVYKPVVCTVAWLLLLLPASFPAILPMPTPSSQSPISACVLSTGGFLCPE